MKRLGFAAAVLVAALAAFSQEQAPAPAAPLRTPAGALLVPAAKARGSSAPVAAVSGFPLSEVRLLDSPFKAAMERNAAYLLSLDPDRLLHNVRLYAGLTPKGAIYGGWERQGVAGHTLGHYLTAISQQFAATGDVRFRKRIDYIVGEMAECQKAYGDGYVGALPPKELGTLRGLREGRVDFFSGSWVPWYTMHKVLAGLTDAWVLGGNPQARGVALRLADWVDGVTASLTENQLQTMLQIEHGGMMDVLAELYGLTGDARYLAVSRRFYHHKVFDALLAGRDELPGKHANTQIPKVIGEARAYEVSGDPDARKIAEFFWDRVAHHHSWVIGGNSDNEHFFPEGEEPRHLGPATAETCNSYNILKLTEHLIDWEPKVEYADFYERVLYNHILASQDPKRGMFTYYVSMKPGLFKTYSTPFDSFWCCVGTGMENHTKYGEAIYFHGEDELFVNLFIPSVLTWTEKGLVLEQKTEYPHGDRTELTFKSAPPGLLALLVRCPGWAAGPLVAELNGKPLVVDAKPGAYARIERQWAPGDHLAVTIPMAVRTEALAGAPNKVAFLYGPLVLAGDFGPAPETSTFPYSGDQFTNFHKKTAGAPVLVASTAGSLGGMLHRIPGEPLAFRTEGLGQPSERHPSSLRRVAVRLLQHLLGRAFQAGLETAPGRDHRRRRKTPGRRHPHRR